MPSLLFLISSIAVPAKAPLITEIIIAASSKTLSPPVSPYVVAPAIVAPIAAPQYCETGKRPPHRQIIDPCIRIS